MIHHRTRCDDVVNSQRSIETRFVPWDVKLTATQIDALERWVEREGKANYRIFYGRNFSHVCAGSGEVSYNLRWDVVKDQVIYLIMYPYSE